MFIPSTCFQRFLRLWSQFKIIKKNSNTNTLSNLIEHKNMHKFKLQRVLKW